MKRNSLIILFILLSLAGLASAKLEFFIYQPIDRTVVYSNKILVEGKAFKDGVTNVLVEGIPATILESGKFQVEVPLGLGKNLLIAEALDQNGKVLARDATRILRLETFLDLNENYWSKTAIQQLATLGVVNGYPDGNFYPNNWITRAELLSMLINLLGDDAAIPGSSRDFKDLTPKHWAYKRVNKAIALGLAKGYPDGTFRPDNTLTRLEAIAIISRFAGLKEAEKVQFDFFDLPEDNWGVKIVAAAKQAGLLGHIKSHYLEPTENISRGESLGILSKTETAQKMIQDLMSFKRGYLLD